MEEMELNIKIRGGTRETIVNALKEVFDLVKGGVDVSTIDNTQKKYESIVELVNSASLNDLEEDGLPWPRNSY